MIGTITGLVVHKNAPHPAEAIKFLKFLTSEQSQIKWAESGQMSPVQGVSDKAKLDEQTQGMLALMSGASGIVPPPQAQRVPIVADYQRDRAEFGEKIDSYTALEGYIVARVMVEGLRRAGKALTRDNFIAGLESIGSTRFGDFPIEYSAKNHNGSTFVDLEMYTRDGQLRR